MMHQALDDETHYMEEGGARSQERDLLCRYSALIQSKFSTQSA